MDNAGKSAILVIAHGHPDFSPGGGEVAAWSLFRAYKRHAAIRKAFFLARIGEMRRDGAIMKHAEDEYLWNQDMRDAFFIEGENLRSSLTHFAEFLKGARPEIVHAHHVIHMGCEILEIIKRTLPQTKIYFTFHEFAPICNNNGQMIKKNGELCSRSGPAACHLCFPQKSDGDFWRRKRRFMHFFSFVDGFFAPSEFLRQRYIEWGLAPEKIITQANGLRPLAPCPPENFENGRVRNRFGFFGRISRYKGLEPVLQELARLPEQERARIVLEIHGAGLGADDAAHEKKLRRKYENLAKEGVIRWMGQYEPDQVSQRMAGIDWVILPSIWWENSPVAIDEAFACKKPVLACRMGGMAEKIRDGIDGLLLAPRSPAAFADAMLHCAGNISLWEKLAANIVKPISIDESANAHLAHMGLVER